MAKMKLNLDMIAYVLVLVGAINWGLVEFVNTNLVETVFGSMPTIMSVVYGAVAASGAYLAYLTFLKK